MTATADQPVLYLNDSSSDEDARSGAVLLVQSAGRSVAVPLAVVVEVMRPQPVEPFSDTVAFVRGLSIVRGAPTPVFHLRALLTGVVDDGAERFVTLRVGPRTVSLAVDAVIGVVNLPEASFSVLPPLLGPDIRERFSAVATLDSALVLVLNAVRLIPDEFWEQREQAASKHDAEVLATGTETQLDDGWTEDSEAEDDATDDEEPPEAK